MGFVLRQEIDEGSRNTSFITCCWENLLSGSLAEDINLTGVGLLATLLCPHTCLLSVSCLVRHITNDRSQEVTWPSPGQWPHLRSPWCYLHHLAPAVSTGRDWLQVFATHQQQIEAVLTPLILLSLWILDMSRDTCTVYSDLLLLFFCRVFSLTLLRRHDGLFPIMFNYMLLLPTLSQHITYSWGCILKVREWLAQST